MISVESALDELAGQIINLGRPFAVPTIVPLRRITSFIEKFAILMANASPGLGSIIPCGILTLCFLINFSTGTTL